MSSTLIVPDSLNREGSLSFQTSLASSVINYKYVVSLIPSHAQDLLLTGAHGLNLDTRLVPKRAIQSTTNNTTERAPLPCVSRRLISRGIFPRVSLPSREKAKNNLLAERRRRARSNGSSAPHIWTGTQGRIVPRAYRQRPSTRA
jgi:hypothetical protein